jgi:phenylpyruvate tautomerase
MPTLLLKTNQNIDKPQQQALLGLCSQRIARALGKPEAYVMVCIETGLTMLFAGSDAPCAYLELKSINLPEETTPVLSQTLCELVGTALAIPGERIYIEFASPQPHMWGWDGTTF